MRELDAATQPQTQEEAAPVAEAVAIPASTPTDEAVNIARKDADLMAEVLGMMIGGHGCGYDIYTYIIPTYIVHT